MWSFPFGDRGLPCEKKGLRYSLDNVNKPKCSQLWQCESPKRYHLKQKWQGVVHLFLWVKTNRFTLLSKTKSIPDLSIWKCPPPLPEHPSTTKCHYILSNMLKWINNKSNSFTCIFLTDSWRCWYSFGGVISRKGFTFFNYKEKCVYIWCDIFCKKK